MKSLFSKYVWLQLILSILLLFGGALIVVFAILNKQNVLEDGLNIIAAVILFLFGLFAILASFLFETNKMFTNSLLYGSACIALGIFLCLGKLVLLEYLVYLLAIFFIVIGVLEIIKAIILIVKKDKRLPLIVVAFIFATLFIAGGILAIIFSTEVRIIFCIVAGVLLFAAGVYLLIFGIKALVEQSKTKEKKPRKPKNQEPQKQQEVKEIDFTKVEESADK